MARICADTNQISKALATANEPHGFGTMRLTLNDIMASA